MKTNLTKTKIKQFINRAVYNHIEMYFPNFDIDSNEGYGRIYFTYKNAKTSKNIIEYSQSLHTFSLNKNIDIRTQIMVKELERVVNEEKQKYY